MEAVRAEHNLSVAVQAPAAVHKSEVAAGAKADLAGADKLGNRAAANSSKAVVEAGKEDVFLEVRTICNNCTLTPSTSLRRLVSKPIGNIRSTIGHRRLRSA